MLGLITPAERTPSGHRLYGEEVFERIRKIELLKLHHTLEEVRKMLSAEDEKKSGPAA
jgi:DNA-binding transcriptional MerR regulator